MSRAELPDDLPSWVGEHVELYLKDGLAAHHWDASTVGLEGTRTTLLMTTTGRRTGKQVITPLIYRPTEDGGYCVIASKGGAPTHREWYLNLRATPEVRIKVADEEFSAVARIAEGEEREKLWQMMTAYWESFPDYQAATDRQIPVLVLKPVSTGNNSQPVR